MGFVTRSGQHGEQFDTLTDLHAHTSVKRDQTWAAKGQEVGRRALAINTEPCTNQGDALPDFKLLCSLGARILMLVSLVASLDPAPARAAEGDSARLVDISGGRKMYLDCLGSGSPAVVLIAGLKG